jgi:hypothetical protein
MRKALNENPVAQLAVVGLLLAVVGLLLVGPMMKKKDSGSQGAAANPVAPGSTVTPSGDAGATAATASAPVATAPATAATGSSTAPAVPGPPLPHAVRTALKDGNVVVLLVVRAGGYDDRLVRDSTERLRRLPGLKVFVTKARGIARYARLTQTVSVDQVPALVVASPVGPAMAKAEVRFGFRSAESVVQAVRDVLYRGPTRTYSPD